MSVITFTTDLGTRDHYVGILRARVAQLLPSAKTIDISHDIEQNNYTNASYVIANTFHYYPEGSIHIISVNIAYSKRPQYIIVYYKKHYFILPDNGMIRLIIEDEAPEKVIKIDLLPETTWENFPACDLFLRAAAILTEGGDTTKIGMEYDNYAQVFKLEPNINDNSIAGHVIYVDAFGNLMTNISKKQFEQARKGRSFSIYLRSNISLDKIFTKYSAVNRGDFVAIFDASNYLQIAVNEGHASHSLGLKTKSNLRIEFK